MDDPERNCSTAKPLLGTRRGETDGKMRGRGGYSRLCFLATACAVDMTAGQVLQGAERWQVANGCRVGVSPNDLRGAFFRLALDLQAEKGPFDLATVVAQMEHTPWHMWTAAMLRADVLWCNDEGESWEPAPADETAAVRASQWRAFLADPWPLAAGGVVALFGRATDHSGIYTVRVGGVRRVLAGETMLVFFCWPTIDILDRRAYHWAMEK